MKPDRIKYVPATHSISYSCVFVLIFIIFILLVLTPLGFLYMITYTNEQIRVVELKVNLTVERRFNELNILIMKNCNTDASELQDIMDNGPSKHKRELKLHKPKVQSLKQSNLTKKQDEYYFILQSQLKIPPIILAQYCSALTNECANVNEKYYEESTKINPDVKVNRFVKDVINKTNNDKDETSSEYDKRLFKPAEIDDVTDKPVSKIHKNTGGPILNLLTSKNGSVNIIENKLGNTEISTKEARESTTQPTSSTTKATTKSTSTAKKSSTTSATTTVNSTKVSSTPSTTKETKTITTSTTSTTTTAKTTTQKPLFDIRQECENILINNMKHLPNLRRCKINRTGTPFYNSYVPGHRYGAYLRDPMPKTKSFSNKFWLTKGYLNKTLYEYDSLTQLDQNKPASALYVLPHHYYGTGHVIYQGSLYYHSYNKSNLLLRYDLHLRKIIANYTLNIFKNDSDPKLCRVYSQHREHVGCVDFNVDENGLWVIYRNGSRKDVYVTKLDDDTMTAQKTVVVQLFSDDSIPAKKRRDAELLPVAQPYVSDYDELSNGFIVCGRVYFVQYKHSRNTSIRYVFDLFNTKEFHYLQTINFLQPFTSITQLTYNPFEEKLYAWDSEHLLTYSIETYFDR